MTYAEASAQLTGPRNQDSRKIANNTYLKRRDAIHAENGIAVELHGSDVLLFLPDGGVRYHTQGYYTQTTKNRMDSFGVPGVSVQADRGNWYLSIAGSADIKHPEFYYYSWCGKCRRSMHIRSTRGVMPQCPRCGTDNRHAHHVPISRRTLLYQDGLIVHPDLSVTGAGPVQHYKQYSNHQDLFFGVFPQNSANV